MTISKSTNKVKRFVKCAVKHMPLCDDDSIFDNADALIELAQKSFSEAARKAAAKHDALGIPTHYAIGGKLEVYTPPRDKTTRS
ncbi:hypothetical protein [Candidatus Magnetomonas plexicatena]|uniref:hypothetical protein n=1 Tax=Candidatus Magnetomonas plexicatena TaxID=2552947 RepID=UPI001C76A012|nr:hypothetical protein E2O03_004535 [Nitrospirales bacterium LBB_01]